MAEETKRSISEMPTQATPATGDLFEVAVVNAQSQTGYSSYKESLAAIADAIAGNFQYPLLLTQTTAKTLAGAINELAQSGGGHTYSTTEQVVGTWIDGSTVYEKTFSTIAIQNETNQVIDNSVSYDKLISADINFNSEVAGNIYMGANLYLAVGISNNALVIVKTQASDYIGWQIDFVTVRYIKTSS